LSKAPLIISQAEELKRFERLGFRECPPLARFVQETDRSVS
jgi:hypothetical protein